MEAAVLVLMVLAVARAENSSVELAMGDLMGNFIGASASLNLWNPYVEMPNEYSASQITLISSNETNLIEVGWHVYPLLYDDNETHIFVRWTILEEGGRIGCFNTYCQGFVQTSTNIQVGSTIDDFYSDLNGTQYLAAFSVLQDSKGDWWVSNDNEPVGYFPSGLLPDLDSGGASTVSFGGRVLDKWNQNRHTYTEMGSGFFPFTGYGFSAFQFNLTVTGATHETTTLSGEELSRLTFEKVGSCYFTYIEKRTGRLYFGGSGFNPRCQQLTSA